MRKASSCFALSRTPFFRVFTDSVEAAAPSLANSSCISMACRSWPFSSAAFSAAAGRTALSSTMPFSMAVWNAARSAAESAAISFFCAVLTLGPFTRYAVYSSL